jgi:hypothetical protein
MTMTCAKCGREVPADRARVAIMLGDGRAALDWPCFEAMLKPGRAVELMRLLRDVTARAREGGAVAARARGEKYQEQPD